MEKQDGNIKLISLVIPCFNEEKNVELLLNELQASLPQKYQYEIIFVDDGSYDNTLNELRRLKQEHPSLKYISFSKNFGHQNAIKAGLDKSNGDAVVMMDGDLQHPPHVIPKLLEKWEEGYEIVYTQRRDDQKIGFVKKITARYFYKFMNYFSNLQIEENTADFRLLDRKVATIASNLQEQDLFWRGLIFWMGFKKAKITYQAKERKYGKTKYPFTKMLGFAINGITSFSTKPLRYAIFLGIFMSFLAALYALYALTLFIFTDRSIAGWTSTVLSITFIGGIQLIILGVIGEYLGKLFMQSKNRPHYIVKETETDIV